MKILPLKRQLVVTNCLLFFQLRLHALDPVFKSLRREVVAAQSIHHDRKTKWGKPLRTIDDDLAFRWVFSFEQPF